MTSVETAVAEEWRPVVGFEGSYKVSNLGRVRSVDRLVAHPTSRTGFGFVRGRVLRLYRNRPRNAYLTVWLGAGVQRYVHRIVAEAFIGPTAGMDVDHRDNDRENNTAENLAIVTHAQNMTAMSERYQERKAS